MKTQTILMIGLLGLGIYAYFTIDKQIKEASAVITEQAENVQSTIAPFKNIISTIQDRPLIQKIYEIQADRPLLTFLRSRPIFSMLGR